MAVSALSPLAERRSSRRDPARAPRRTETAADALEPAFRLLIRRRDRLERLLGMGAPAIVLRNEARLLAAAVEALVETCRPGPNLAARRAAPAEPGPVIESKRTHDPETKRRP